MVGHLAGTQEASVGFPAHISSPAMSSSSLLCRSREQSLTELALSTPFSEETATNICLLTYRAPEQPYIIPSSDCSQEHISLSATLIFKALEQILWYTWST